MVMPHMTKDRAVERAERLRGAMAALSIPCGSSPIAVTVSLGVATFPCDGRTYDELIVAADGALYKAKAAGRNHVHASEHSTALVFKTDGSGIDNSKSRNTFGADIAGDRPETSPLGHEMLCIDVVPVVIDDVLNTQ